MSFFHWSGSARHVLKKPSKNRTKDSAERKVQKIDNSSRRSSELRRVSFLNYGVRQHGCAGGHTGEKANHISGENSCAAKEYPCHARKKCSRTSYDHRLSPPQTV